MNLTKLIALSMFFGVAMVSVASASTSYGFDLWGGGIGKKGTMKVVNAGDAMITGVTLGIVDRKHRFKYNGQKRKEISLAESVIDGYGLSSFKVKTTKRNGKAKAFSKVLFNNGKRKNGYISVDFMVDGEEKTIRTSLRDVRKQYFMKKKFRGEMQLLADAYMVGFFEPGTPIQSAGGGQSGSPSEPGGCVDQCGGGNSPSVVPIPAALPLMLSGLFGMGLIARRRKA